MAHAAPIVPAQILLVEDSPSDVRITRDAIADAKILNELHVVSNGEEALKFLRREGDFRDAARPDLILLDLNLPRVSGLDVLAEIKSDPELRRIPVAVLTTSSEDRDIVGAYDRHVNCYLTKPVDFNEFARVVRSIEDFFLSIVRLAPE
jgi:chemotaxis family two-component system response regulator Rcp1